MHTNKGGNPVFFCKLLFCSMILILHSSCPLSFLFPKSADLPARWGCSALVFLVLITAYFTPTSFRWDVPTNETTIRIHCDLSTFHLSNPQQKESLITALSSTPFFRPFFNSNHGSYDPQRETHFLISFHSEQKYAKVQLRFQRLIIVSCLLRQTPACTQKVQIHSMTYFAKSLLFKHSFGALRTRRKDASRAASSLAHFPAPVYSIPLNRL